MVPSSPDGAASDGAAQRISSSETLHHHAWVVLQTGLGHAPRSVLHTIVEAHAGFQARSEDETFFMVRSRLVPILPRGMQWRTFTNHRSSLVRLGLLELVWRAPNQHSDYSRWRIRYDNVLSAQPREQLALPIDDLDGGYGPNLRADSAESPEERADVAEKVTPAGVRRGVVGERDYLAQQIAQMKTWLASGAERLSELEARLEALVVAERELDRRSLESGNEHSAVPRAERRRRERRAGKEARESPAIAANSAFIQSVLTVMKELQVTLAEDDLSRFRDVEAKWRELRSGDIPESFLAYAVRRMWESNPDRPIGYIIGILNSTVEKGYTEDDPSGRGKTGRYLPRRNRY